MAAEVRSLPLLTPAPGPSTSTADQTYWRSFRSQLLLPSPQSSPVTHISCPSTTVTPTTTAAAASTPPGPELFTITSGTRITLLSTRTRRATKTITRISLSDVAHSGELRRDGRIVLAGGSSGAIQAFDAGSRAVLRTWREHHEGTGVWCVRWNPARATECLSCGDDGTVRVWDLPGEASLGTFIGHEDYVRAGAYLDGHGGKVVVSGSYDRTVRVWDARSGKGVMCFAFADPVECVLGLDGGTVVTGAGEKVGVLDLTAGRPREVLRNHQKAVTALSTASQGRRVVSGGLDGHVKVFDTSDWKVVAGFKYPSPVLSVGVIPSGTEREDRHLCVGMQSGLLSIRTRLSGQQKAAARAKEKEMKALVDGTIEEFDRKNKKKLRQGDKRRSRGKDFTGEGADIIIDGNARGKIRNQSKWETALRKGQWQQSIDLVLQPQNVNKDAMVTLLTALHHRSALRTALSGRDESTLVPLFKWITKNINDPRYAKLLSDVSLHLLDIYAPQMAGEDRGEQSLDTLVATLHRKVRQAVELAQTAGSTGGMLDFIGVEAG